MYYILTQGGRNSRTIFQQRILFPIADLLRIIWLHYSHPWSWNNKENIYSDHKNSCGLFKLFYNFKMAHFQQAGCACLVKLGTWDWCRNFKTEALWLDWWAESEEPLLPILFCHLFSVWPWQRHQEGQWQQHPSATGIGISGFSLNCQGNWDWNCFLIFQPVLTGMLMKKLASAWACLRAKICSRSHKTPPFISPYQKEERWSWVDFRPSGSSFLITL